MTNEEIDTMIAATHASEVWTDGEKYQLIQKYEAARPKATSIEPATEEELDKVFGSLWMSGLPTKAKTPPEPAKTADDKILDEICKYL